MSTSRGRSMHSKVERKMQKESVKTREMRRANKIKKKLMTDEERLLYNLKRAKKKVALLLQKLKKYELPTSIHDPELFTPEQLQAFKNIGFRNKNYVPICVHLEELSKICISTGNFMRPCKFGTNAHSGVKSESNFENGVKRKVFTRKWCDFMANIQHHQAKKPPKREAVSCGGSFAKETAQGEGGFKAKSP